MKFKMVNPCFQISNFTDGGKLYTLVFDGWEGIGNVDDDGDEFYYEITADDQCYPYCHALAYGYSWFFDKVFEDEAVEADFSDTEVEIVVNAMMEMIRENKEG